MKRDASTETLNAILGGPLTNHRRSLFRVPGDKTVPIDPANMRLACGIVDSRVSGWPSMHLPIISALFGAEDESLDGRVVRIRAKASGDVELLAAVLNTHEISLAVTEADAAINAIRSITLEARKNNTFAVCDASVPTHRIVYVQEPFAEAENRILIDALHEAGITCDRIHELSSEIGSTAARTPWSIREAIAPDLES